MINFFNPNLLVERLRTNSVPEFHKFLYLFLPLLAVKIFSSEGLALITPLLNGDQFPFFEMIKFSFHLGIFVVGMAFLWRINKNGDNQNFVLRFICLSFIGYLILNIISFCIGILSPLVLHLMNLEGPAAGHAYSYVYDGALALNALLFWGLMVHWMRKASQKSAIA